MNIDHAKATPLREILTRLNYKPKRTSQHKLWYLSPLRTEKTASFVVNLQLNSWYDFGEGIGGDVVNFVCAYLKSHKEEHTVSDALRWISNMAGDITPDWCVFRHQEPLKEESALVLKRTQSIQNKGLIQYLDSRGIAFDVANKHLKEVRLHNKNSDKCFTALGLLNEDGGMELRNPFFKGCFKTKSFSFVRGYDPTSHGIHVFEGMMDYLSLATIKRTQSLKDDALILNSVSCLNPAMSYIKNYHYNIAYSWMDNDRAGTMATDHLDLFFKSYEIMQHKPMNTLYAAYKDVNAWHMHKKNLVI
jgi:hypothetical protein